MSTNEEITNMEEGGCNSPRKEDGICGPDSIVYVIQKVIAEGLGTYFLVFAGCCSVVLNKKDGSVSSAGVCIVFGLTAMVMIYSVGHISGGHFNPAVTVTFAIFRQFPLRQVPLYVIAQLVGSILASGTLYLMFEVDEKSYFGTVPSGSDLQSFVMEILATFFLMFVGSAVTTDNRAIGELAGIAVGMTISVDLFIAGPVSGGSLNPARSLGPAIIMNIYDGIWIYMIGPFIGTITGCFAYTLIRFTKIPLKEMTKTSKFLKSVSMARPNHL